MDRAEAIKELGIVKPQALRCANTVLCDAIDMAIAALREQEQREQNEPLTLEELRKMNGETVWCLELNTEVQVKTPKVGFIRVFYSLPGSDGTYLAHELTLFRLKPTGGAEE